MWRYLDADRSVIPVDADKKPLVKWATWQTRCPERLLVHKWAGKFPGCGWAMVTGAVSDVLVLDFDGPAGDALRKELRLPRHVATPSGGSHVYVTLPDFPVRTKARPDQARFPNLDVKSEGGSATFFGENRRSFRKELVEFDVLPAKVRRLLRTLEKREPTSTERAELPDDFDSFVPASRLLAAATFDVSHGEARNDRGFRLACELRDERVAQEEAETTMREYQEHVDGDEPYTWAEALASLRSAFAQPARPPRMLASAESEPPATVRVPTPGLRVTTASSVTIEPVRWLKEPYIPLGTIIGLVGTGGLGKSSIAIDLTADATNGELGGDVSNPCDVIIVSTEDHIARVIVPRLIAVDADLDRVHFVEREDESALVVPDDLARLDAVIEQHGVKLVIFDPVVALLPENVNSWSQQSVRTVLAEMKRRAEERDLSFLAILHTNKRESNDAGMRMSGSHAWRDSFRSVLFVGSDPEDPDVRVMVHEKTNTGVRGPSLTYRIVPATVEDGNGTLVATCRIEWAEESDHTAESLLAGPSRSEAPKFTAAKQMLMGRLADGPVDVETLQAEALEQDIGWRTVERAKADLGVVAERESESGTRGAGKWTWRLPSR